MNKHTPSPWWFSQYDSDGRYDVGHGDQALLRTVSPNDAHANANARLAACAPELLQALEEAREVVAAVAESGNPDSLLLERIDALIQKAKGT